MQDVSANELTASAAAAAICSGELTSEQLAAACLARIEQVDPRVHAWTYLNPARVLEQAREADRLQRSGAQLGPLHGIPVAVKDVFDTCDMPTELGTVLHAGRRPSEDATAVALLRRAGAIVMGKTVTTEMAVSAPGKTTNPHDPKRTPGGSSSGSAAAVGAMMVPLALGTQTNGSMIRPASYCGVYGFKPSHGSISRIGVIKQSPTLDQVGVFARSVEDLALISRVLMAHDPRDADSAADAQLGLDGDWSLGAGKPPRIAFVKSPQWPHASAACQHAFGELVSRWREFVTEVQLPTVFDEGLACHRVIMESDLATNFAADCARGKDVMGAVLREMLDRGQRYTAVEYSRARNGMDAMRVALEALFSQYDAVLTPATTGAAPLGLAMTGSPMFCTLWTLCGVPAISLPILRGEDGMPLGAQLVAGKKRDAHLLRVASWLVQEGASRG